MDGLARGNAAFGQYGMRSHLSSADQSAVSAA